MTKNTETIVMVEHHAFGVGEIVEIELESPASILVEWGDGTKSRHKADELEFVQKNKN